MPTPPRFERTGKRNRFTARRATVLAVERPAAGVVRVTLGGPDFGDFESTGPADHIRLFFPDDASGVFRAPTPAADGDGIVRPDGPTIHRDYTPLNPVGDGERGSVQADFMDHENPGPATRWAQTTTIGDEIVVVGPRGSKAAPRDLDGFLAIVDETALPSLTRWLADLPSGIPVTLVVSTPRDAAWVLGYLDRAADDVTLHLVPPAESVAARVAGLGGIDGGTYVFAAGEAGALAEVRRHLLGERGLLPEQVAISGYWRRGEVGFDHHTPLGDDEPSHRA
jgi:NADPH-dependent ferric siderophore reductase